MSNKNEWDPDALKINLNPSPEEDEFNIWLDEKIKEESDEDKKKTFKYAKDLRKDFLKSKADAAKKKRDAAWKSFQAHNKTKVSKEEEQEILKSWGISKCTGHDEQGKPCRNNRRDYGEMPLCEDCYNAWANDCAIVESDS